MSRLSPGLLNPIGQTDNWIQASSALCGPSSILARAVRLKDQNANQQADWLTESANSGESPLVNFTQCFYEQIELAMQATTDHFERLFAGLEGKERAVAIEQAKETLQSLKSMLEIRLGRGESHAGTRGGESPVEIIEADNENPVVTKCALPILLVRDGPRFNTRDRERGVVGLLKIGQSRGSPGTPLRVGYLGLTALSRDTQGEDPTGFRDGVKRAWNVAGIGDPKTTYPWWIDPIDVEVFPPFERLSDRSCEAAFTCALWAAAGGIPHEQSTVKDELDPQGSVTAMLDHSHLQGRNTPLLPIAGLPDKVLAAFRRGITLVVVANGQKENKQPGQDKADIDRIDPEILKHVQIVEVATVGEAFDELMLSSRVMRAHRKKCLNDWNERFYDVDDDGKPIDQQLAEAESGLALAQGRLL